jgi:hypothetical protein
MECALLTSFTSHSDQVCYSAASEQDKIGWQNFVEGKIPNHWGHLQLLHYQESHSKWLEDRWTSSLVSHLLELTHGSYVGSLKWHWPRCRQTGSTCMSCHIEAAIHKEFARVLTVLLDATSISFNEDGIMLCPCPQWTSRLAPRDPTCLRLLWYFSSCPSTTTTTIDGGFLLYCRWLISPQLHHLSNYTQSLNCSLDIVHHLILMVMPSHGQLLFDQVGGSIMGCSIFFSFSVLIHR